MIGPASCDFILKGAYSEEIEMVQDILNSYIEYDITPGKAIAYETLDEQSANDDTWMIDLCDDGVLKIRHSSDLPVHECRILYEKEDRSRLIEQMVLMVSGMREKVLDYEFDILPILEKRCRYICTDDSNGDLITKVVSKVTEMNKSVVEKGMNDYDFLIQLCDCDMLFAADIYDSIEGVEDSDNVTFDDQIILYRSSAGYKGSGPKYGIASIFTPVL